MSKKTKERAKLISRIHMYIFFTLAYLTWISIVHAYAYADLELCKITPEIFQTSPFIDIVTKD